MSPRLALRRRLAAVALSCSMMFALPALARADDSADDDTVTAFSAGQCAAGRFCIWSAAGYAGAFWSTASAGVQSTPVATARTVWNRSGVAVRLYASDDGTGSWTCVASGALLTSTSISSSSVRTMTTTGC